MKMSDPGYHLKLIEMCDCYLETDFAARLAQMVKTPGADVDEEAVKYLALAILFAVTEKAGKLSFKKKGGEVSVKIKGSDGKIELPSPTPEIYTKIDGIVRAILHLEEDNGAMPLSLGLKNTRLDLQVSLEKKDGKEKLTIALPEL